jgi:hypothetical protein
MTTRERFVGTMEYQSVDRVPNWEAGVWGQTRDRWSAEGLRDHDLHWDWFVGEEYFAMDEREYADVNFGMLPTFEPEVIREDERYIIARNRKGIVTRALKAGTSHGTRASMDEYIEFPLEKPEDFRKLKERYISDHMGRYPAQWRQLRLPAWRDRDHVLILGRNCSTAGFYWRAREWMGTEGVSYGWYDYPSLMHEMMEFIVDFTIEVSRPIVHEIDFDYVMIAEDFAMKSGPLLGPQTYKEFIFPHMRRLVDFLKANGVRYVMVDSDGNVEPLLPLLLDAGVDAIWPIERASESMDPLELRRKYGRFLRLFGGVDKRELSKDTAAIDAHLKSLAPLIEEGGFIPTVDHTVPPDVSLANFRHYMEQKAKLCEGKLG